MDGTLQIHSISLKPYACCRLFHSTIDALAELTANFTMRINDIREIVISGPQLIADQHMLAQPGSTMAAQYSCPYIVGATLSYGPYRYDAYDDAFLGDPQIRRIAERVRFEASDALTQYYPTRFATGVRIVRDDGNAQSSVVIDSVGTPAETADARPDHRERRRPEVAWRARIGWQGVRRARSRRSQRWPDARAGAGNRVVRDQCNGSEE